MSRRRSTIIIASGGVFGCALLVFMDGAVMASKAKLPYNFLMWLPTLVALLGTFVLSLVKPVYILGTDSDLDDDDDGIKKAKSMFFVGALLLFTSICLSIWKTVDPYGNKGVAWPGAALLVHSLLLMLMNYALFIARAQYDED
ncbi:Uncharacterised protein family (UPF0220) [Leishmania donovani]|uniref:Uncharacterized protein family (UPF0220), putative n=1 Tax=Leishmania donovani TaxID=5661 RepID=A0A3S7X1P5_LEIDO|nr:hypothetical protein, conserved [Leishmania donovani]AYU80379.1 Uncharacterized protein family (UPF0220), putative [Leishmania donovani]TPP40417.1 hypothetical protein CGC20_13010 [Leishmania donovani]TPP54354.1 hypothetical protein CGC21_22565 [Leishmania donovani]CAJ1990367.1 Uncharacterised protein family (UPF0220) [Leishmania donovani]CBZ35629.1 hypothetical protein, conserved [Leishmania donovani]